MEFINVNSREHRDLMLKAIKDKNVFLIQQLSELKGSRCTRVVVIETTLDLLKYSSSYTEKAGETDFMLYADEAAIEFFLRLER